MKTSSYGCSCSDGPPPGGASTRMTQTPTPPWSSPTSSCAEALTGSSSCLTTYTWRSIHDPQPGLRLEPRGCYFEALEQTHAGEGSNELQRARAGGALSVASRCHRGRSGTGWSGHGLLPGPPGQTVRDSRRSRLDRRRLGDRWDSLVLFTPRRYDGLPGLAFPGDPDGYPTRDEVIAYLERYAATFDLPVEPGSSVRSQQAVDGHFVAELEDRRLEADQVVGATGP